MFPPSFPYICFWKRKGAGKAADLGNGQAAQGQKYATGSQVTSKKLYATGRLEFRPAENGQLEARAECRQIRQAAKGQFYGKWKYAAQVTCWRDKKA